MLGLRVVGLAPAAEDSLGHVGLAAFVLCVALASGFVTSAGVFVTYIVTRQEYLLDLVRAGEGEGGEREKDRQTDRQTDRERERGTPRDGIGDERLT